MADITPSRCDQCGQVDTAPKHHLYSPSGADDPDPWKTRHHDCLSVDDRALVVASSEQAAAVIEACEAGTKNDDLREFITNLPTPEPNTQEA